jgi:hypothetical protein
MTAESAEHRLGMHRDRIEVDKPCPIDIDPTAVDDL